MKKLKKIIVFVIVLLFVGVTSFVMLNPWNMGIKEFYSLRLPKTEKNKNVDIPNSYFVDLKDNSVYLQGYNQCGAYSSSFVLRNLGVEVYGEEIYQSMSPKMKNGYLMPDALIKLFKKFGYKAVLKKGDLDDLKSELVKGRPVIVVIGKGFDWQHYVVVTGYDKNSIYTVDSLVSKGSFTYNKKYSNENFLKLWKNNLPIFNSLYIGVE